jgi:mono/diheme cytochrome c family protein
MPRVSRWFGVAAVLAVAIASGGATRSAQAQQAPAPEGVQPPQSTEGTQSRFVGSDLYRNYCVTCHGKTGRGDGALAEMLKKRPPDLTMFSRNNGGVFPSEMVRKIVDGRQPVPGHGGRDMPVWGDAFKSAHGGGGETAVHERIDALVRYLETLQVKATN